MTFGKSSVISILAVVLVCCLLLSPPLSAAVLADSSTASPATITGEPDSATDRIGETAEIDVDDDLPDTGQTTVVVRLEELPVADIPAEDVDDRLEEHAETTQEPLLEYAAETPGLAVEEELWLTNAIVLAVDLERVDLETLGRFDAVEAVHENFAVSVPDPEPGANETAASVDGMAVSVSTDSGSEANGADDSTRTNVRTTANIAQVNAPSVWANYETRGEGVRVAVLDTGIDADHPDLELYTDDPSDPTYPGGWAEFDSNGDRVPDSTPHDTGRHGTHVSGTVAGGSTTGTAIGVAPDAELMHGLVLPEGNGTFSQIVAGMEWAVAAEADALTMSLGTTGTHPQLIGPVRNARESGTIVVGAIGNDGPGTSGSPGNVHETISVGAVDRNGTVASFSGGGQLNRTDWAATPETWPDSYTVPDVVAPGVGIPSTVPGGVYARMPGTSMATPHVSGLIALLLSIEPEATPDQLEAVLTETAWKPDDASLAAGHDDPIHAPDERYGHGIVDAEAAADKLVESVGHLGDNVSDSDSSSETETASADSSSNATDTETGAGTETATTTDHSWVPRVAAIALAAIGGTVGVLVAYGYRIRADE